MPRDPYRYFRIEARELIDQLGQGVLSLEKGGGSDTAAQLLRLAHTLKGAARVVRLTEIAENAHAIEGLLQPFRASGPIAPAVVSDILARLDGIAETVGGLPSAGPPPDRAGPDAEAPAPAVAVPLTEPDREHVDAVLEIVAEAAAEVGGIRSALEGLGRAVRLCDLLVNQLAARAGPSEGQVRTRDGRALVLAEELREIVGSIERVVGPGCDRTDRELRQVRDTAEQLRLAPAGSIFANLDRVARDAATALGRSVDLTTGGGTIRIDAAVLRKVHEALAQVVRNAVAHGIEDEADRIAAGKPPRGRISVSVDRRDRRAVFRCEDDGRGIDLAAVRLAAIRQGLPAGDVDRLDTNAVARLILRGGLSTSTAVTEISGRGIGMDIVSRAAESLGGEIAVRTVPGRGTTIELAVPLSLAAVEALTVEADGITAFIPLDAVRSARRTADAEITRSPGGDTIVVDAEVVPFTPLHRLISHEATATRSAGRAATALLVAGSGGTVAIGVDRLGGTAQVVHRPLPALAPASPVVAGASLDVGGVPQLVLDVDALVEAALRPRPLAEGQSPDRPLDVLVVDDSLTTRMLEQSILQSAGHSVDLAASAEEGLERAHTKRYDLFLVDIEMPGMDGYGFIERIRADPALTDIPAILVTSLASTEAIRRGEAVGAKGYMVKSEFDQARLLALIRRLTGRDHV